MAADRVRVLEELRLPLAPGAGVLEAIAIAVALEDALGVTIPEECLEASILGQRASIVSVLSTIGPPP